MLSPQTIEQIETLATEMASMFSPPELIVGCEVLGIADKDQYAANNGWVEARVGHHNQQRCRWRGQFPDIQVGDYIDVLFFASYRLFVVFGQGGIAAIPDIVKLDTPPVAGAIITGDDTPEWVVLPPGQAGQYVTPNGTTGELEWRDIPTVGITEFLYDLASDIATYSQMKSDVPTGGAQTIVSAAISASDTLIFSLATNAGGPGVDFINDGVWHLHLHAQKSGPGTKDVTLKFRVYTRTDPGGVETQIGSGYSEATGNLTTSAAEYDLHLALDELALDITDRIVLKIYADVSGAGTDPTVTLTVEGTTDSRLEIPALVTTAPVAGWPFAHVITVSTTDPDADYDNIPDAITAASAGDIILLDPETYTLAASLAVNKSITLMCLDPYGATITFGSSNNPTINVTGASAKLVNLNVIHSGATILGNAIKAAANGVVLENCIATSSGTPTTGYGIFVVDATQVEIRNCQGYQSGAGTLSAGIGIDINDDAIIYGGIFSGDDADVYLASGATCELLNTPKLANSVLTNNGTYTGLYVDAYDRLVRPKPIGINNVRLTLTSGTPVTTSNVTAATTIYAALYKGNTIEVYNGSGWTEAPFAELSLSLSGFTADKNSDVFVYDNAGTLALERVEWTNDTTRATALTTQDGRYVKNGDATRLYLGTFRTTGTTGQCEDSVTHRYVWNYYNRVLRDLLRTYSASHTYNTATWRAFNNSATNAQVDMVIGVLEDAMKIASGGEIVYAAGDNNPNLGCGVNTTSGTTLAAVVMAIVGQLYIWTHGAVKGQTGYNYVCPVEFTSGGGGTAPTYRESTVSVLLPM